VDKQRACEAAPTSQPERRRERTILADNYHRHFQPFSLCTLGSDAKVEAVAGIVLHYEESSRRACHSTQRREDSVDTRRCKYITAHRGVEHAHAHKTHVCGLVTAATATDERNLPFVKRAPDDNLNIR